MPVALEYYRISAAASPPAAPEKAEGRPASPEEVLRMLDRSGDAGRAAATTAGPSGPSSP
ncbi:MAG: hypothetical protein ACM3L8_02855, partial [Verrucomicrobiota bacterium]